MLSVSAPAGVPLSVAVYNLKGVAVARHTGFENISIDFNPMAPGIYIVKANGKTIKFTR
nr:T9SS type A sorting domain-containing protein [Duncaniella muris]